MENENCERIAKLAYLGGIIDGEGTIGIHRRRERRWRKKDDYRLIVRVTNTELTMLERCKETCGEGRIELHREKTNNWQRVYRLVLTMNDSRKILEEVLPFLIIKKAQAILGLEFYAKCVEGKQRIGAPFWLQEKRKEYYQQMAVLNKRGNGE